MQDFQVRSRSASAAFARRNGGSLSYSAISDDASGGASGRDFSAATRRMLFELGGQRARDGTAWTSPVIPQ